MRRSGVFVAAVMACMVLLSGAAFAKTVEFKFAHSGSLEHQYHIGAEYFKKLVEEKSGGEMKVTIFPQGQLGGERDLAEGVRMGTVEIGSASPGNMAGFAPELELFGVPFLFQTKKQVYTALDGEVGEYFNKILLDKGFMNLAYWEVGFRNMTNNVRPVKTPEDMKGLKIRVQESKIKVELIKSLGAIPTPIPFGELYSALQQKVVDGQENPIATIYSMKFYEVQKYVSLTNHTYEPALVFANPKWFNSLSPQHQQILKEAAMETAIYQRAKLAELDSERMDVMKKDGVEIEEKPDLKAFAEATKDLYKVLGDVIPLKMMEKIRNIPLE
ncbi:2,3-diketo-L-gulonate transporter substrate-binding protein YiaO [Aminivibrio sp.]